MERASNRFSGLAGALVAASFGLTLAPSPEAWAQEAAPSDAATAAAEQPQSRRERRRAAEAAAAAEKSAQAQPAAEPGVSALAETVVAAEEEEELVCKMYKQSGTKIGRRVCGTQAEWDAWADRTAAEAKDVVREIGDRSKFPAAPQVPAAFPTP
jgi:hypothetical protein